MPMLLNVRLCTFLKLLFNILVKGGSPAGGAEAVFHPSACRFPACCRIEQLIRSFLGAIADLLCV